MTEVIIVECNDHEYGPIPSDMVNLAVPNSVDFDAERTAFRKAWSDWRVAAARARGPQPGSFTDWLIRRCGAKRSEAVEVVWL
jgi:hypothetical protein